MESTDIAFRNGNLKDINQIYNLQRKYDYPSQFNKADGFIRVLLDKVQIAEIIEAKSLFVVCDRNKVIGFFLIASCSNYINYLDEFFDNAKKFYPHLSSLSRKRIGLNFQICIEKKFRRNKLASSLLDYALNQLKDNFDILIGLASKENKTGYLFWQTKTEEIIFDEYNNKWIIFFNLKRLKTKYSHLESNQYTENF